LLAERSSLVHVHWFMVQATKPGTCVIMNVMKKLMPAAIVLALLAAMPAPAFALSSSAAAAAVASATGGQVLAVQPAGGGFRVKVRVGGQVKWCSVSGSGSVSC
jgi:hypothetical protein